MASPMASYSPASGNPQLRGVLLIVAAWGVFALMDTIAKYLARHYPVEGVVWARYAMNLVVLTVFLAARGELRYVRTARPGIQLARGALLGGATMMFFTSLTVLPIAEAAAIGFVMPLFLALLAVPLLKERIVPGSLAAIVVGLSGALVIARPGSALFTAYALLPVGTALANALYQILTRKVAGLEPPLTSLFYGALVGTVMFSFVLPFAWVTPGPAWHWLLLVLMGVLASVGHFTLIRAFDHAPATLLAPFAYSYLVWGALLGFAVFGDFPDGTSLAGMAIIAASGLYLVNHQRLAMRR
jgi:drug/metabolite transporter (DMT)-like permease